MHIKDYIKTKVASEINKFGLRDLIQAVTGNKFVSKEELLKHKPDALPLQQILADKGLYTVPSKDYYKNK